MLRAMNDFSNIFTQFVAFKRKHGTIVVLIAAGGVTNSR